MSLQITTDQISLRNLICKPLGIFWGYPLLFYSTLLYYTSQKHDISSVPLCEALLYIDNHFLWMWNNIPQSLHILALVTLLCSVNLGFISCPFAATHITFTCVQVWNQLKHCKMNGATTNPQGDLGLHYFAQSAECASLLSDWCDAIA